MIRAKKRVLLAPPLGRVSGERIRGYSARVRWPRLRRATRFMALAIALHN